jgi:hypothetical protein
MGTALARTVAVLAFAFALPVAHAATPSDVVADCADDGAIDGGYTDAERRGALKEIPADLDEYSECRAMIGAGIGKAGGWGEGTKDGDGGEEFGAGSGAGTGAGTGAGGRAGKSAGAAGERPRGKGRGGANVSGRVLNGEPGAGSGDGDTAGAGDGVPGWLLAALGGGALAALGAARELRRRS